MKLVLLNLGKRGASLHLSLGLLRAAADLPDLDVRLVLSSHNELPEAFEPFAAKVTTIDTFSRQAPFGAILNFGAARRKLLTYLRRERPDVVLTVMPHVWTPLLLAPIRALGIRYATIIHDAAPHLGDPKARLTRWLRSEAFAADLTITLSHSVAGTLVAAGLPRDRVLPLFHPDMEALPRSGTRQRQPHSGPLALLFLGRIHAYKGVDTLLEAMLALTTSAPVARLTIAGQGDTKSLAPLIAATGTRLINKWLSETEIGDLLDTHDAVVLPYREASQSGVAALAFAAGLPVVAFPVGGIIEQVTDGETGVLAPGQDAHALATAIDRLARDPQLLEAISERLSATADSRSMRTLLRRIVDRLSA
ncbi:hypothetical protein VW23_001865 [Devosia insulae DS-56]|uniref:Glycosyltransferase subfamily 4-like N-terminal domain-containing protein n=1 Tax=Devosia insulae DS-56 TaxID=1116389 RepID=A0A1E5XM47_9HYPH|nr:glycosyltransferase family 4 protein [Devosia insulae]OEO29662.1 hypothetical protein VW23_001865 [Devosia insulae DS-56]